MGGYASDWCNETTRMWNTDGWSQMTGGASVIYYSGSKSDEQTLQCKPKGSISKEAQPCFFRLCASVHQPTTITAGY